MHFHLPQVTSFTDLVHQVKDVMKHYKHEKESEAHQVSQMKFQLSICILINVSRFTGRPPVISLRVVFLKLLIQYVIIDRYR